MRAAISALCVLILSASAFAAADLPAEFAFSFGSIKAVSRQAPALTTPTSSISLKGVPSNGGNAFFFDHGVYQQSVLLGISGDEQLAQATYEICAGGGQNRDCASVDFDFPQLTVNQNHTISYKGAVIGDWSGGIFGHASLRKPYHLRSDMREERVGQPGRSYLAKVVDVYLEN
jgi:hypothetical protein